jgi:hypothetical protein
LALNIIDFINKSVWRAFGICSKDTSTLSKRAES